MGNDYISELSRLRIPWYILYGEEDRIVPVSESINNIEQLMSKSGNDSYSIEIVENGNHMLENMETGEWYPFEAKIIGWILELTSE